MKHFYVINNETKDPCRRTAGKISDYLRKRHATCIVQEEVGVYDDIPEDADCVIVLGGDGTLLRASRNLINKNIPFIGINLGTLGYLTEGDRNNVPEILERLLADEYVVEERMMLTGDVISPDGESVHEDVALNDLTINRNKSLRVFSFKLYVNGEFLYMYTADGIIISTPTGSTAYNLSCGGPIVEPTARLFLITPIAPHSLNNRSLILAPSDTIELEIIGNEKDIGTDVQYVAYFDGDSEAELLPGSRITIRRAEQVTKIVKLSTQSFLETLRTKMS